VAAARRLPSLSSSSHTHMSASQSSILRTGEKEARRVQRSLMATTYLHASKDVFSSGERRRAAGLQPLPVCSGDCTFFGPRLYWRHTVPKRSPYVHTHSLKTSSSVAWQLNSLAKRVRKRAWVSALPAWQKGWWSSTTVPGERQRERKGGKGEYDTVVVRNEKVTRVHRDYGQSALLLRIDVN
jgi:hypothetical protein